jgi:ABC-type branched-subunit amino acid transport system substrate-binding protein
VSRTRLISLIAALMLVAVACGQKPGVHVATGSGGGVLAGQSTNNDVSGGDATATGTDAATSSAGSTSGATSSGGSTSGGSTSGGTKTGTSGGSSASSGPVKPTGHDRTGVTADKITLALHAPVTGAAPLPVTAFEKERDLYWRYVTEIQHQKVLGRSKVEVQFQDDKYQPNTAVQACRELGASSFLVVGGGGTDQIQACGRYAESAKIPYLSAGVTETGLTGLQWYFSLSMSYKQQGKLLAQYVAKNFPGKKVAAVITDTPNFDDAVAGWEAGVKAANLSYYKTLRHPKSDTSWYNTFANELQSNKVDVVFILTAPVDYIRFAQQANGQGYKPQFVGVGISMGLNAVLGSGCPNVDGGIFFSPFPGLDWGRQNLPEFFATAKQLGVEADDLGIALWGLAKSQDEMFKRYAATYGTDLTREDFRKLVEQQQGIHTGVFPDQSFSPASHFGSTTVHVLKADCGSKEYKTLATFATGF